MAYSTPSTPVSGQPITTTWGQTVVDDLEYLKGNAGAVTLGNSVAANSYSSTSFSLADSATQDIGTSTSNVELHVWIANHTSVSLGIYLLRGTNHGTSEITDPGGIYTTTKDSALSANIYWESGSSVYRIQNKLGTTYTFMATLFGSV